MPELPEVEMVARLAGEAVAGAVVDSVTVRGPGTLKSYDPPVGSLSGSRIEGVRRRGKHLLVDFEGGPVLLAHLMSSGRMQVYPKKGSPGDRTLRVGLGLRDGREIRFREFGTRQSLWVKLICDEASEPALATLGPEAWPDPPELAGLLQGESRPLHSLLRDQRVIAGIGRSWADEILHCARLSPFKRAGTLDGAEAARLRACIAGELQRAVEHYSRELAMPMPDRFPMPLHVHGKVGKPCPACGATLAGVHFEDYTVAYCPSCQTGGRLLKDRRLSRLLR